MFKRILQCLPTVGVHECGIETLSSVFTMPGRNVFFVRSFLTRLILQQEPKTHLILVVADQMVQLTYLCFGCAPGKQGISEVSALSWVKSFLILLNLLRFNHATPPDLPYS